MTLDLSHMDLPLSLRNLACLGSVASTFGVVRLAFMVFLLDAASSNSSMSPQSSACAELVVPTLDFLHPGSFLFLQHHA